MIGLSMTIKNFDTCSPICPPQMLTLIMLKKHLCILVSLPVALALSSPKIFAKLTGKKLSLVLLECHCYFPGRLFMKDHSMPSHGVGTTPTLSWSSPPGPIPSTFCFLEVQGGIYFSRVPQFNAELFTVTWLGRANGSWLEYWNSVHSTITHSSRAAIPKFKGSALNVSKWLCTSQVRLFFTSPAFTAVKPRHCLFLKLILALETRRRAEKPQSTILLSRH